MAGKSIAIITARGGSKRIPRKNIRPFCGQPIISYSIQAALKSEIFEEVMVSTDDEEIAEIALKAGALVPFIRSEKNSNDYATTTDVIFEVLEQYKSQGRNFDFFCCIYPTAPFVTAEKLKEAHSLLLKSQAPVVVPVVSFSYPIQRALKIQNGLLSMIDPQNMNSRSQDLMPTYHDSGQFYFGRVAAFMETRNLFVKNPLPLIIPEIEVQDIDNEQDWQIAELKFRMMNLR